MQGPGQQAFKKLKILLDRMMLRRTKVRQPNKLYYTNHSTDFSLQLQKADDLGLPPRTVIVRRDYFSPEEKELYLSLFSDAKRQFTTYLDQGTVLNSKHDVLFIPISHANNSTMIRLFEYLQFVSAYMRRPNDILKFVCSG